MRILTIASELGPGGTERAAQNCTLVYRDAGHEVAVLALDKGGTRGDQMAAQGIPVWVGGYGADELDAALDQAIAWKADFIHVHRPGFDDARTAGVLRRLKAAATNRVPVIETSHFSRCDRSDDRRLIDVHIHMSTWCLWKWQQWSRGLSPPPLGVVIPHLIDLSQFFRVSEEQRQAYRRSLDIPEGAFAFGRLGQPFRNGWSPLILEAFQRHAMKHPNAVLVVIGLPDSMRRRVESLPSAIRQRILERPFVHGDVELRQCYSALDCFLHAKHIGESFGYVLIESLMCETPVITLSTPTRDNSQVEVVGHQRGGLVVGSVDGMVQAMEQIEVNESLRHQLARQGAQWVRSQYSKEVVAPRLLRLIELTTALSDQTELRRQLEAIGFSTMVSQEQIDALSSRVLGATPRSARIIMRLAHNPRLYGAYRAFKRIWASHRSS